MSDAVLRECERRWRATGDRALEARYLAERLRSGRWPRERLELAAYLGHVPSREALGDGAPAGQHVPWRRWQRALDPAGHAAVIRGAMSLLEAQAEVEATGHGFLQGALGRLLEWCDCPCPAHASRLAETIPPEGLGHPAFSLEGAEPPEPSLYATASLLRELGRAVIHEADLVEDPLGVQLLRVAGAARRGHARPAGWLLAWALGPAHGASADALAGPPDGPEAEARWLLDRARRGDLDRSRLALAAHALDPGARAALGTPEPDPAALEVGRWLEGLAPWGETWARRAAVWFAAEAVDPFSAWIELPEGAGAPGEGERFTRGLRTITEAASALGSWAEQGGAPERAALDDHEGPLDALATDPRVTSVWREGASGAAIAATLDVLRAALRLVRAGVGDGPALARKAARGCPDPAQRAATLRRMVARWALRVE